MRYFGLIILLLLLNPFVSICDEEKLSTLDQALADIKYNVENGIDINYKKVFELAITKNRSQDLLDCVESHYTDSRDLQIAKSILLFRSGRVEDGISEFKQLLFCCNVNELFQMYTSLLLENGLFDDCLREEFDSYFVADSKNLDYLGYEEELTRLYGLMQLIRLKDPFYSFESFLEDVSLEQEDGGAAKLSILKCFIYLIDGNNSKADLALDEIDKEVMSDSLEKHLPLYKSMVSFISSNEQKGLEYLESFKNSYFSDPVYVVSRCLRLIYIFRRDHKNNKKVLPISDYLLKNEYFIGNKDKISGDEYARIIDHHQMALHDNGLYDLSISQCINLMQTDFGKNIAGGNAAYNYALHLKNTLKKEKEAKDLLLNILEEYKDFPDSELVVIVLYELARLEINNGNYDTASDFLRDALARVKVIPEVNQIDIKLLINSKLLEIKKVKQG